MRKAASPREQEPAAARRLAAEASPEEVANVEGEDEEDEAEEGSQTGRLRGVAGKATLELQGTHALSVPARYRRLGPIGVDARPMLVGGRHQPELHSAAAAAGCEEFASPDQFCVACLGGEFWLFAVVPLSVIREDGSWKSLGRDDFIRLSSQDHVVLAGSGDASSRDAAQRRLYWNFSEEACQPEGP
jgi:hypothetical protein